jgi:subtilase family serine protease
VGKLEISAGSAQGTYGGSEARRRRSPIQSSGQWQILGAVRGWKELPSLRQTILPAALLFVLVTPVSAAHAQSSTIKSTNADEQRIVRLANTHHPLANEANASGRVEGSRAQRRMLLVLSPGEAQEQELKNLLEGQQARTSANYHHWLTAAEFGTRFGATDADVQKVRVWLEEAGFTVERVATSKRWLEFTGTAGQVESAFHTLMQYYRVNGKTFVANSTDLAIPAEFSGITRGVVSLNNFGKRPAIREGHGVVGRTAQGRRIKLSPSLTATGATDTYYLAPGDFAAIYNTKELVSEGIDGSGVSIVVTAQSQIELTDVEQFRQIFGLRANDPNIVVSGPDPGIASETDSDAAMLDVEWAGAVAPGATIDVVVAGSTDATSGVDLAAAYAVDNEVAPIVTYTYESCEQALGQTGNAFYNALWQQAAAEGITVLVASGDNGAAGCDGANSGTPAGLGPGVNGVASTPFNVAVGGTEFADIAQPTFHWNGVNTSGYASPMGYIPESAWNESCDPGQAVSGTNCAFASGNFSFLAGAGGTSAVYPKPAWQMGTGVPADGARDLPDVALAAASGHDETVYCTSLGGTPCQIDAQQEVVGLTLVGGTSASTAAMAGILALVEQKNGTLQGQVNYVLYRLAQMQGNSCNSSMRTSWAAQNACVFYDLTSGSNAVPCAGGSPGCSSTQTETNGFLTGGLAGVGYDMATGLGSVNATNLANGWKNVADTASQTGSQASSASFAVSVTPATIGMPAGSAGSGRVAITPSGGFTGPVNLACGTGGTFIPAGYTCTFGSSTVQVNGTTATTTLNLTPSSTAAAAVKSATAFEGGAAVWGTGFAAGLLLLGFAVFGSGGARGARNFLAACGLVVCVACSILGCGGGAGRVGPLSTTTTIVSSNLHSAFGMPVTFNVRVTPNGAATPTGQVQLYDNGQAYGSPVNVNAGIASFLATNLPVGVHNLSADYRGDANTQASSSTPITQAITGTVVLQISGTSGGITATTAFNVQVN